VPLSEAERLNAAMRNQKSVTKIEFSGSKVLGHRRQNSSLNLIGLSVVNTGKSSRFAAAGIAGRIDLASIEVADAPCWRLGGAPVKWHILCFSGNSTNRCGTSLHWREHGSSALGVSRCILGVF
jgi:hypothetical protein